MAGLVARALAVRHLPGLAESLAETMRTQQNLLARFTEVSIETVRKALKKTR